jgi:hypothetical protein
VKIYVSKPLSLFASEWYDLNRIQQNIFFHPQSAGYL